MNKSSVYHITEKRIAGCSQRCKKCGKILVQSNNTDSFREETAVWWLGRGRCNGLSEAELVFGKFRPCK